MSTVTPFPHIKHELRECAGCNTRIVGEHWRVDLPHDGRIKQLALCDKCYADAEKAGVL